GARGGGIAGGAGDPWGGKERRRRGAAGGDVPGGGPGRGRRGGGGDLPPVPRRKGEAAHRRPHADGAGARRDGESRVPRLDGKDRFGALSGGWEFFFGPRGSRVHAACARPGRVRGHSA